MRPAPGSQSSRTREPAILAGGSRRGPRRARGSRKEGGCSAGAARCPPGPCPRPGGSRDNSWRGTADWASPRAEGPRASRDRAYIPGSTSPRDRAGSQTPPAGRAGTSVWGGRVARPGKATPARRRPTPRSLLRRPRARSRGGRGTPGGPRATFRLPRRRRPPRRQGCCHRRRGAPSGPGGRPRPIWGRRGPDPTAPCGR